MRLSTAGTLALTILLATSTLVAVVAAPSVVALEPDAALEPEPGPGVEPDPTADHRFAPEASAQPVLATAPTTQSVQATPEQALAVDGNRTPFEPANPPQVLRINITEEGHAVWTIESRYNLTEENVNAFREWANAVTARERQVWYDIQRFRSAAATAEQATNRQMAIENPSWEETRVERIEAAEADETNETYVGTLSYTFTWTNFARVDDNRIYVGDVFHEPDEPPLDRLLDGQRLVIDYPANYALETPTQLSWDGPHEFEDGELEIVFVRGAVGGVSIWLAGAGLVLLLLGASAGYLAYRYRQGLEDDEGSPELPEPIATLVGSVFDGVGDAETAPIGGESAPRSPADAAAEADTHIEYEEEDDEIDPELLSDEERVHRMLERNGGRMKQANIVKETGWSNAKVSQLLSQMDEDDKIEKLRIGRENLITLPEVDPTEVD